MRQAQGESRLSREGGLGRTLWECETLNSQAEEEDLQENFEKQEET